MSPEQATGNRDVLESGAGSSTDGPWDTQGELALDSNAHRPVLYILCGLPSAGKSTLCREMARTLQIGIVEIDAINSSRGLIPNSAAQWAETYRTSYEAITAFLIKGQSAIHDATNFTHEQRDRLHAIADKYSAVSAVVYVNVPDTECVLRWTQNRLTGERDDMGDEDFANVVENFEAPDTQENVICFDGTIPISQWINEVLLRS